MEGQIPAGTRFRASLSLLRRQRFVYRACTAFPESYRIGTAQIKSDWHGGGNLANASGILTILTILTAADTGPL